MRKVFTTKKRSEIGDGDEGWEYNEVGCKSVLVKNNKNFPLIHEREKVVKFSWAEKNNNFQVEFCN